MSALVTEAGPSVSVQGGRALWTEAIARVLEGAGLDVRRDANGVDPAVTVVVEPGTIGWSASGPNPESHETRVPAIVLEATEPSPERLVELVSLGAFAVLTTTCDAARLARAVRWVAAGESGLSRAQTRTLVEAMQARAEASSPRAVELTTREREILDGIQRGLSVKQSARELSISPRTVENTKRLLFRKLGVRNRAEAVAFVLAAGLLTPTPTGGAQ